LNNKVYGSGTFGSPGAKAGSYPGVGVNAKDLLKFTKEIA